MTNGFKYPDYEWKIGETLPLLLDDTSNVKFVLVILNTPLLWPFDYLRSVWKKAALRVTVDGGANSWLTTIQKYIEGGGKIDECDFLPDLISGDFDSITPEAFAYYKNRGVKTVFTYNQEETDFYKALKLAIKTCPEIHTVITLCEYYGRFDHSMSNLNTLYKICNVPEYQHINLYLMNPTSITWLLKPGKHKLHIPPHLWSNRAGCSLIPIGQPCYDVTTTGLEWNLKNGTLKFGGMISSSNKYDTKNPDPVVTVITDNYLVWYMSLNLEPKTLKVNENLIDA